MSDFQFAVDTGSSDGSTFINRVFRECDPSIFETDATCSICYQPFSKTTDPSEDGDLPHFPVHLRKCGHPFGLGCVQQWFMLLSTGDDSDTYTAQNNSCPMCRAVVFDFSDGQMRRYDPWSRSYGGGRRLGEAHPGETGDSADTNMAFEIAVAAGLRPPARLPIVSPTLGTQTVHNHPTLIQLVSLQHMIHGLGRRLGEDNLASGNSNSANSSDNATPALTPVIPRGTELDRVYQHDNEDDNDDEHAPAHSYRPWRGHYGAGHTLGEAFREQIDPVVSNDAVTASVSPAVPISPIPRTTNNRSRFRYQSSMRGTGRRLGESTETPAEEVPTPVETPLQQSPVATPAEPSSSDPLPARPWSGRGSGRRLDDDASQEAPPVNVQSYRFRPPALSYHETRWQRRHGGGQRLG